MNILIFGCGYLGRRVASLYVEQGARVFATTRNLDRAQAFRKMGLHPLVCDVLNPTSLRNLPQVDAVIYAVGMDRTSGRSMGEVYVGGLGNVLAAVRRNLQAGEVFTYISSTSVYGQTDGEWVNEEDRTEPAGTSGRIILEAEALVRAEAAAGAKTRILRFAGIYGPGRIIYGEAVRAGRIPPGDPERWLNLIHVDDGARAVLACVECGRDGEVYNVADDKPVRRRQYWRALANVLGVSEPAPAAYPPGSEHDTANRRIRNTKVKQDLRLALHYPSYREGVPACIGTPR